MNEQQAGLRSYRPGDWYAVFGPEVIVLLPPDERGRIAQLWELVDAGADLEETLDALIATGLRGLSAFALVGPAGDGATRVVLRGAALATVRSDGPEGTTEFDGTSAASWVDRTFTDVTGLTVAVGTDAGPDHLISDGLVRVARIDQPPHAVPLAAPPAPPSAPPAPTSAPPLAPPVPPAPVAAPDIPPPPVAEPEPLPEPVAEPVVEVVPEPELEAAPFEEPEPEPEPYVVPEPLVEPEPEPEAVPYVEPEPEVEPESDEHPDDAPTEAFFLDDLLGGVDPASATVPEPLLPPMPPVPPAPPVMPAPLLPPPTLPPPGLPPMPSGPPDLPEPALPPPPPAPPVRAVAVLHFSSGDIIEVDRPLLVGRSPEARQFGAGDQPLLVPVPSPHQEISATHLEIRPGDGADAGSAVITDLGSTNGTLLVQPGQPAETLQPGVTVQLLPGSLVDLGDGLSIRVD